MRNRLMLVGVASLLLVASTAGFASEAPAESQHPTATNDTAESAGADGAVVAWDAAIQHALAASSSARDRALAASDPSKRNDAMLRQAAADAPDDVLVQWLAATHLGTGAAASINAAKASAARLTQLEPDNGATWWLVSTLADQRGDRDTARDGLTKLAESTRFDMHLTDLVQAMLKAYAQLAPRPQIAEKPLASPWSDVFIVALLRATEMAVGVADNVMLDRCVDGSPAALDQRRDCVRAGTLMSQHAVGLGGRLIGYGLLRVANGGVLSDAERMGQRQVDWYIHGAALLLGGKRNLDAADVAAFESDWQAGFGEIEIAQHGMRMAGITLKPPKEWVSPREEALAPIVMRNDVPARPPAPDKGGNKATSDPVASTVRAALAQSADPRDRTLAEANGDATDVPALQEAAKIGADDALVQWLAASHLAEVHAITASNASLARLERIEPDNAAVWMLALALANDRRDASAQDRVVTGMIESTRFDDPADQLMHVWLDGWDRFAPQNSESGFAAVSKQVEASMGPGIGYLAQACPRGVAKTGNLRAACAHVGSLMLQQGTSFRTRFLGVVILQNLDGRVATSNPNYAMSDADRAAMRLTDWYQFAYRHDPTASDDHEADWRELPNWVAIARRSLERAGLPSAPPADWKPARDNPASAD